MHYLHTMVRVSDLDESLHFYCRCLGLIEVSRQHNELGRFSLVFLAAANDVESAKQANLPLIELTHNWDSEKLSGGRNFGHLAFRVSDIYSVCDQLLQAGVTVNRPPRDGHMAFVLSPDNISVELLQANAALPAKEPWISMPNQGEW